SPQRTTNRVKLWLQILCQQESRAGAQMGKRPVANKGSVLFWEEGNETNSLWHSDGVMAAADPAKTFEDEASCPICLEYFNDPVTLDCGHNFCRACITRCWEGSDTDVFCPCCMEIFPQGNFQANRQLGTLVDLIIRQLKDEQQQAKLGGERVCGKHQEALKLFCEEDQTPICVVLTLDPDTANPWLAVSADGKSVHWGVARQDLPNHPERFDPAPCVLASEGFASGRHSWEVEVGEGAVWVVGVALEPVKRKGESTFTPEQRVWAVRKYWEQHWALTCPETPLYLHGVPRRIRIYVDYEGGLVAFYDAGNEAPIFTFPPAPFVGEKIRPFFDLQAVMRTEIAESHQSKY
uniref:Tripartite motif containing 58 n=1 Tax=Gopherus agassizii TaxID=38772 RepID=A0A452IHL1_9SAUR